MVFKNIIFIFILVLVTNSCNRSFERALDSNDKDVMLNTANQLYEDGNYGDALVLYEKVAPLAIGTPDAALITYNSAYANYADKNYKLAALQFKNFHNSFPKDSTAQDALFQSAYCYYLGSGEYNLDQENTNSAIKELQDYINVYPDSDKVLSSNTYIQELQDKLEKKAFEGAKTFYNTAQYKASAQAMSNVLEEYPSTKYKEEVLIYILRSKYELAMKSILTKKEARITDAKTEQKQLLLQYPNSKYKDEANDMLEDLTIEMAKFKKLITRPS